MVDNSDSDRVFEVTLPAPDVKSVTVNDIDWKVSVNHPNDDDLHLWLTKGTHHVVVETGEGVTKYEVVVSPTGNANLTQYFEVTYTLTDLITDAAATVYAGETLSGSFTATNGKQLPGSITVTMGGADAEFSYDAQTGAFSVPNASGDIVIVAAAVDGTPVDKSELEAVIAEAEALNEADYTSGTWRTLEEELESARVIAADEDASQADVDEAADALRSAIDGLIERGDKTELNDLIAEAEALNEEDYTTDTWATLEDALEAARAVAEDEDAIQAEIDEAKAALEDAMDGLIPVNAIYSIEVGNVNGRPGESVVVPVRANNLAAAVISVEYDPEVLTYAGYTNLAPEGSMMIVNDSTPGMLAIAVANTSGNYYGEFMTLNFKAAEDASEITELALTVNSASVIVGGASTDVDVSDIEAINGSVDFSTPIYTVTFIDGYTGEVIYIDEVHEGEAATAPEVSGHDAEPFPYIFIGWDKEFSAVMEDMTVTANFALLGDVNFDGEVNITDALIIARQQVGYDELDEAAMIVADVNGDGIVNITDILLLMRVLVGLETSN